MTMKGLKTVRQSEGNLSVISFPQVAGETSALLLVDLPQFVRAPLALAMGDQRPKLS